MIIANPNRLCAKFQCLSLNVKQEHQHITVLHNVLFAFRAHLAGVFGALLAFASDEIVISNGFRADEAFFEIGVNHACGLRRFGAALDGLGAHFFGADGEIGNQFQQFVTFTNHAAQARF